ncbi:MAG TPA: NAD+ synthase [Rhodospirillaceae bacterium]|nr:NAD+ synthase [Rhodospirillaceae bacterium]
MSDSLKLALLQLNPIMGDITGNMTKLSKAWQKAREEGCDIVITSELFLTGYPPQDFVLKPRIHKILRRSVEELARETASGPAILLGTPWKDETGLYNAALLLEGGQIIAQTYKHELPNYGPFDEKRVYQKGKLPNVMLWRDCRLGVMLCEDMWNEEVSRHLAAQDAELFIVMNGSPYEAEKNKLRHSIAQKRIDETGVPLIYINQVGGQDELLFEGASFVYDSKKEIVAQAQSWGEEILPLTVHHQDRYLVPQKSTVAPSPEKNVSTYQGLMVGIHDFVTKNKFERVLIGLSGGIDSALTAAIAVDALGSNKVRTIMMPSPYTSAESLEDAAMMAKNLECRLDTIPISDTMRAFDLALSEQFMGCEPDVTEENIQARIRGVLLMALANKSGAMVLATGNKSEMAVGYTTLYGDMCGGYAPLKDVYKTGVYELAQWRQNNKPETSHGPNRTIFPDRILTKAPSAELRPNQKDEDSLPPYEILDQILHCLIEQDLGVAETMAMGQDSQIIRQIYMMLDAAEYKRQQSPSGPKVSCKHLGLDRRYPITNRYADRWHAQKTD